MSEQLPSLKPLVRLSGQDVRVQLISDFQSYLVARGHAPRTQELCGTAVAHFVHWLCEEPPERQHMDTQSVRTFLQDHFPSCHCTRSGSHDLKNVRAALNQLLSMLGGDRLHPPVPSDPPAIVTLVGRFDTYLNQVCGLAEATRWYHRRNVRTFLQGLFGDATVDCSQISAEDLRRFVYEHGLWSAAWQCRCHRVLVTHLSPVSPAPGRGACRVDPRGAKTSRLVARPVVTQPERGGTGTFLGRL